jgi:TRAP-type C4-dicarboxylate transport system substrate-binding protein
MKDFEHLLRVDDSDLLQNGYDTIRNDHSVRVLGQPIYVGWRNATSNKPLRTVDDIQGLKIRDPPIDSWIRTWEGIGANPVSTPSDEIYSALETGVAAASGADANGAMSTNLYEVQSHFNIVKYLVGNRSLWVNEDFYSGLDETYQDMVTQFSQEASEEASQQGMDKEQEIIGNLKENGMTIVDDVEIEAIREAARPTLESLFENNWEGTLEQVRNI